MKLNFDQYILVSLFALDKVQAIFDMEKSNPQGEANLTKANVAEIANHLVKANNS